MNKLLLPALGLAALALPASADTLFESAPVGSNVVNNQYSPSTGTLRQFALARIEVGGAGWNIDSVTMYNSTSSGATVGPLPVDAHLHIVADADLATFDPTGLSDVASPSSSQVITTSTPFAAGLTEFTVDPASDITIGPGVYWIGVTPIVDNLSPIGVGWQFARRGSVAGEVAIYADAGSLTGTSTTASASEVWETRDDSIAILIQGTVVPEPTSLALLGLGGLAFLRRRR